MANNISEGKVREPGALRRFYRGTIFQAVILGLISFTQPGIWPALNNLGPGGQAEPYVVNAANAITFVVMVFFSPLASIVGNIIGMRWVVFIGCIGYVPYSAALYCTSVWGTKWFLMQDRAPGEDEAEGGGDGVAPSGSEVEGVRVGVVAKE